MVKAIFFDIDGTLVPPGHIAPPSDVIKALSELREKGIKIFIASGRHPEWIINLGDLEVDGYVTCNGSMCLEAGSDKPFYIYPVKHEDIENLIEFSHKSGMPIVTVPAEGGIIISRFDEDVKKASEILRLPEIPVRDLETIRGKEIVQIMAFGSEEDRINASLFDSILKNCEPTSWNPNFYDIVPKGSGKDVGIDRMIEHYGINIDETMAFGDGDNDTSMIRHAGIGVAMGNGVDAVKRVADFVTTDILDNGIINALKHYGLIEPAF